MSRVADARIVANPLLALDGVTALLDLDADTRAKVGAALKAIQLDARDRAEKSWRTHKAPMAAYWKAVSVYAGHLGRIVRA